MMRKHIRAGFIIITIQSYETLLYALTLVIKISAQRFNFLQGKAREHVHTKGALM